MGPQGQPGQPGQPSPPAALLGTRDNPVPGGIAAALSDGWVLTVVSVAPDATEMVRKANPTVYPDGGYAETFNEPPPAGHQFFVVTIEATLFGETDTGRAPFDGNRLTAVGPSGVRYEASSSNAWFFPEFSCGALDSDIGRAASDAIVGGTVTGTVCWAVTPSDAKTLMMFDSTGGGISDQVWFSLTE